MPTYAVTAAGRITQDQRAAIARALTAIHHEEARAPRYLVQVVFYDLPTGSHYIGGEPAAVGQIWVRADIRAGRTQDQKSRMLERVVAEVGAVTGTPAEEIYVYINDIPAGNIIEWGRILPEPGVEEAWQGTLPTAIGERLRRIG